MKKLAYLFATLVVAVVATSCKSKNNPESEDAYVLRAKVIVDKSNASAKEMRSVAENALCSAGFLQMGYTLVLEGDSAAVASQLAAKMQIVETAIKDSKIECPMEIKVRGVHKQDLDKEKCHYVLFYSKLFGPLQWGVSTYGMYDDTKHSYRFVKWFRTDIGWYYDQQGDYFIQCGDDLNSGAGGDYLYLMLEHSGKAAQNSDNEFQWEAEYADTYPTDVIVIYGSKPITIMIEDRLYYLQQECYDLNYSTDKTPIYLYVTNDPYPGYENYYLNTGVYYYEEKQCRMLFSHGNFNASDYLQHSFSAKDHDFVDRVVQAYDGDGNHVGEADCNHNAGGEFVKLIMTYCKHE